KVRLAQLGRQVSVAVVVALVLAAPYLPTLFHWAAQGGAAGVRDASAATAALVPRDLELFNTFGTGVGFDVPLRGALMIVGAWQAVRWQTGRAVARIGTLLAALAAPAVCVLPALQAVRDGAACQGAHLDRLLMTLGV